MKINNFYLKVGKSPLLENVNIEFENNRVNHLLGKNGTGKSCFAKSLIGALNIKGDVGVSSNDIVIVSSYSNIPSDLLTQDVINYSKSNEGTLFDYIYNKLKIFNIPNIKIRKLSDGQKQKLKLLYFITKKSKLIILDEFTNALDKNTCMELYTFINDFINQNDVTILNITHNLTDLECIDGKYFLIDERKIKTIESKEKAIELYIKG